MSSELKRRIVRTVKGVGKTTGAAATLGHISLNPFLFHFDFDVGKVTGGNLKKVRSVVLVIERRNSVEVSEVRKVDEGVVVFEQCIGLDATLFRKMDGIVFEMKRLKLAVRERSKDGKTVGKIHLNLADYADVGGRERRTLMKLSDGSKLEVNVCSKLISSRERGIGRFGTKSEYTGMTTGSSGWSRTDSLNDDDSIFDGDGLDLDEPSGREKSKGKWKRDAGNDEEISKFKAKINELMEENEALKQKAIELDSDFTNLQQEAEENLEELNQMEKENEILKDEIAELKVRLDRMPDNMDVVNQLTIAKMELAVANMERDEAQLELQKLKKRK